MTDELHPTDPLHAAVDALRVAPGVVPGLPERAANRRRRRQRVRIGSGVMASALLIASALLAGRGGDDGSITFALVVPESSGVSLVGDFTEWQTDRVRLQPAGGDRWEVKLKLPPGRYRFAYVTDEGDWHADASAPPALDDFGDPTSVVTVLGE